MIMPAFKSHNTTTSESPWDGPAKKARVKSGEKRSYYARIFAWYDPEGDEGVKETYKFIHHEVGEDGAPGPANLAACSTGIGILNGGRGGTVVPAADRKGLHAHLARHLEAAGKEAAPLTDIRESPLLTHIQDRIWALLPSKLEELAMVVEARLSGGEIAAAAAPGRSGGRAGDAYTVQDGVAVLPVYGLLEKRMNLLQSLSGGTSTEILGRDFRQALADPEVAAIVLDVESPGGAVDGTKEMADLVLAARNVKPVVAYGNGLMASAAYWIGSAASLVMAGETAQVGSIGVALMHFDRSGRDEQMGIKRTSIYAGKFKRLASDEKPLSDEGREYLQSLVDTYYGMFMEAVSQHRGVEAETVLSDMADGRVFIGKQAKKQGLVDKLGTLEDAIKEARKMAGAGAGKQRIRMEEETMPTTKEELQAQNPELLAGLLDEGKLAGEMEGTAAERERVLRILHLGGDADTTMTAIREGWDHAQAAEQLFLAEKGRRANALQGLEQGAVKPLGVKPEENDSGADFMTQAEGLVRDGKAKNKAEAVKMLVRERPELHQAYVEGQQAKNA
jgi:capsid assembly protease